MTEAVVVTLFLTVRVLLVGGILLALPRIMRKGLVFGAYVGEAVADGGAVRVLVRSWDRGCLLVMTLSLAVGYSISLAGWPLAGNLTGTAVLLLGASLLYLHTFRRARMLAPPAVARQATVSSASLSARASKTEALARIALAICVAVGLGTIAYAAISYGNMPAQVATHMGFLSRTDELADKSLVSVLYLPCLSLLLSATFALLGVLVAGAKRSVRAGTGSHSAAAQEVYNSVQVQFFGGTALFFSLALTALAVEYIRVAQGEIQSISYRVLWIIISALVFMLWIVIRILRVSGQGGSLLEKGTVKTPLTGGLADNAHWIWGVFYVNRDDPSMMIESRFGLGYSLNLGNWRAVLCMGVPLVLILILIVLPFTGAVQ